jgi:DNA/RNA-binding domain of Phe-tRNA-synthetase-like protein
MSSDIKFVISHDVKDRFPHIDVFIAPVNNIRVSKPEHFVEDRLLVEQKNKVSEQLFFEQPMIKRYREFYEVLGFDTSKKTPSVESIYRRFLKSGKFPNVNNIVNTVNNVALTTYVPLGVFDREHVVGDIVLRFSLEGEAFTPIGGTPEKLPAGLVVMADERKVLSQFFYRDNDLIKITDQTRNVLVLGCKVAGVTAQVVEDAVKEAAQRIKQAAAMSVV